MRTLACTALMLAAACGPLRATGVVDDAEVALARAHAADGDRYAPYETTMADLYLAKAKEEQSHARYSSAAELGRVALDQAKLAARKAVERKSSEEPPPAPRATIERKDGGK